MLLKMLQTFNYMQIKTLQENKTPLTPSSPPGPGPGPRISNSFCLFAFLSFYLQMHLNEFCSAWKIPILDFAVLHRNVSEIYI